MQYRIVEWDERYEVDDRGREWTAGKAKRKGPLAFIRLKVHGRSQGVGWRKLIAQAGRGRALMVFGLFCKLLEIAGDHERDERGWFEDRPDNHISFILSVPTKQIAFALKVLTDLHWVEILTESGVDNLLDVEIGKRVKNDEQSKTLLEKRKTCKSAHGAEQNGVTSTKNLLEKRKTCKSDQNGLTCDRTHSDDVEVVTQKPHLSRQEGGFLSPPRVKLGNFPGDSRELPEIPHPTNQPNQYNQHNQPCARASGDGSVPVPEAVALSGEPGPSPWALTRQAARTAFGRDPGIDAALTKIANSFMLDRPGLDQAADTIRELVAESQAKADKPSAYFMGAIQKRYRCLHGKGGQSRPKNST